MKPYPALQSTQSDVEQLEKIYSLFRQYKEFQESMSSMLWGDLDITALQKVFILYRIYLYQSGSSNLSNVWLNGWMTIRGEGKISENKRNVIKKETRGEDESDWEMKIVEDDSFSIGPYKYDKR